MNRFRKYIVIFSAISAFLCGLAIWSPAAPQARGAAAQQARGAGASQTPGIAPTTVEWPAYRGGPSGGQFADLGQINAANVHKLKVAWEFHTGDTGGSMYTNPLIVDGVMYISTAQNNAEAIDARTGRLMWKFVASKYNANNAVITLRNRGVTYWKGAEGARIFSYAKDRVYALDAKTGALITSFGTDGFIDLRQHLDIDPNTATIEMTTPGMVYKNFLILPSRVNESFGSSPGHIRAYDTVTGQFKWVFHTIPEEGEPGYDTWGQRPKGETYGGANPWGGITIDEKRGWAFAATGSATEDYWGGLRKGADLFANCVLALDATTGKLIWYYQTIHHDLFDYDNPPAPMLVTLHPPGGQPHDVVVQGNKDGYTYVLDRDTGKPLFPVTEIPAPRSIVPGEETYPTQPVPSLPKPLVRQNTTEADLTNISPEAHAFALNQFRHLLSGPVFTPASLQGTIMTPGWFGGEQWGGGTFDPMTNFYFVNSNESPSIGTIRQVYEAEISPGGAGRGSPNVTPAQLGRQIYDTKCAACHGADRAGTPPIIPGVRNELDRKKPEEIREILRTGFNAMPAFNELRPQEVTAVIEFLKTDPTKDTAATENRTGALVRYASGGTRQFSDPDGHPAIAPPWGELTAINLVTGDFAWRVPLGEYPDLVAKGIRNTGTLNFGGPVFTAGGIVFIAGTADEKFRAFESFSGRLLWETQLPAGGYATPSVYMLDGKEYVVISAGGGGKNGTKRGDSIVAFTLPDEGNVPDNSSLNLKPSADGWISLFDGKSLDGWVHLNGSNTFNVEDGAIVGRTMPGSLNSFLCTTSEWSDFELELETTVDPVTNQGIQFRTSTRPVTLQGGRGGWESQAGRIYGPQAEVRRFYPGQQTTGLLYGEGMMTGWFSSPDKWAVGNGHHFFVDEGWNKMRIVAQGPHIQTWVNDHPVEDLVNEDLYKAHPKGFIGLQIHALTGREPGFKENGLDVNVPSVMKWRNIRIRPLPSR